MKSRAIEPQHHGGRLRKAAADYGIALDDWLDLSTGINPVGWPVRPVPANVWSRLPEDNDGLEAAGAAYYGAPSVLPVAGSQVAIQLLPQLWSASRVTVMSPAYSEHAAAWAAAGHQVRTVAAAELEAVLPDTDIMVLINPNNPTGDSWTVKQLLEWHAQLAARGGILLVDEAFADCTPAISLAGYVDRHGLIVLRSLGKFFGLAGLRLGFVCATSDVLDLLQSRLGPWHVSTPARWVGAAALRDRPWQDAARMYLQQASQRLQALLIENGLKPTGGCALFQWVQTPRANALYEILAGRGILTRLFNDPAALRFGLPESEQSWQRLQAALKILQTTADGE